MSQPELSRLVPEAPGSLLHILDAGRGPVEPPNRSEIFGPERFAQHGRSLGDTHAARHSRAGSAAFFPRLRDNIRVLREAHQTIALQATTGYDISPAAEWLLDNFHLIEAQLSEIRQGLPRRYFRNLPILQDQPLVGLPRVYGVAWAFVAHTDSAFNEDLLLHFLRAYQQTRQLTLGELWALPTTLRVVLIENLRRLAERTATTKAAREVANLCADRLQTCTPADLDVVLGELNRRGVGEAFLAQMAQRLQDLRMPDDTRYADWLRAAAPDLAGVQTRQPAIQAADNLSVSNAITSLRAIGDADWPDIVAQTSTLIQAMLTSPAFEAEREDTRDQTLHAIELLARRCERSERDVATILLELMQRPDRSEPSDLDASGAANHWLRGSGRPELMQALGLRESFASSWRRAVRRSALPLYLTVMAVFTLALVGWLLSRSSVSWQAQAPWWLTLATATLMFFPASEAVVAVINRLISESARPVRMPRLALLTGIPPEHRVMVVIPSMLMDFDTVHELAHRLQLHHLANPERNAQFALLTDWADAPERHQPDDEALLDAAVREINLLNARYADPELDGAPRFIVLHRHRQYAESERRWMGWERKRGKLEQLVSTLATGDRGPFIDRGVASQLASGIQYLVTLDSDTRLPPGRLRDLVGVAAHPHNQPRLDATGKRVDRGYGILQPRVVTPLPAPDKVTLYHWLFAGQWGIDPYSVATSEVYQDVFGEGTFTGKGLLHVKAAHAVLAGRLPTSQVLSHDLLEGSLARCAAVTDITVVEEAPFHADVAASRVHRWTRGDWQLLPVIVNNRRYGIRAINRWKMLDNLRRSLVAPMSLGLLAMALGSTVVSPWAALVVVAAAFAAGPMMGAVAAFAPSRDDIAKRLFFRQAAVDLGRSLLSGLWLLAELLALGINSADAVLRALYRTFVSRRHLLEWTTAAAAEASASNDPIAIARKQWKVGATALVIAIALAAAGTPYLAWSLLACAIWAASPLWSWWVSRPRRSHAVALSVTDQTYLTTAARDTWRLFERCVNAAENHLPPDNLQVVPSSMVAHRTSPTNIGLYLLAAACAREFGWIGTADVLARLEATLATLEKLPRHRGHFFNWYDTQSMAALLPMYVSTVDSGNLSSHFLAVAQACHEWIRAPASDAPQRALAMTASRIQARRAVAPAVAWPPAVERVLALSDPLNAMAADLDALLDAAQLAVDAMSAADAAATGPNLTAELGWLLADHLATLRSHRRDIDTRAGGGTPLDATHERLRAVATACQRLAWEPDFAFLYHRKRRLLHIGYRMAEQQLDSSFYDLLASESRVTSLLAIAKGDVPPAHWPALGRPFYASGAIAGLRSWSGSMFEYLMPTLVLDEPDGSVLYDAARAAVQEQVDFAGEHSVPWGISESAYAASDHTLAYQYSPQGVPRLALRRTPPDELVIAPYATALAAQMRPMQATANLRRLEANAARGRYGFLEALDYTSARQSGDEGVTRVQTFMAHHQGMSIVALANVLLDGTPRRWGMGDPRIEAVSSVLHERAPREVPMLVTPPAVAQRLLPSRRAPGMQFEMVPGMAAVEPTHLLSNGRYAVALRSNGSGWSRWGDISLTRWRDDALRDAYGSYLHLRWDRQPRAVSITQHPAPDPAAHYQTVFHADRVTFTAAWPELEAVSTVWVSPEDDIEFREVVLRNLSDRVLDIEMMSAFEVSMADSRADEAHPAFQNLFVSAEWLPRHQALVFERRPRLPTERSLKAAHFIAETDLPLGGVRIQVDRQRWIGRNRDAHDPLASFDAPPSARPEAETPPSPSSMHTTAGEGVTLDTGLDPVSAMSIRMQIGPRAKARLVLGTAASDNPATLLAVIDKYRQPSHVDRSSMMSATLTGIRLREMRINRENFTAVHTLTTALALTLAKPQAAAAEANDVCDRRLLWRFGISGDRPIVLVSAGVSQGLGLLRSIAQALRIWSWGGLGCDLVVVNSEPTSYLMDLSRDIAALRESHTADTAAQPGAAQAGFFVLLAADVRPDELSTLRALARVRLNADGRALAHHVAEWTALHDAALEEREAVSNVAVPAALRAEGVQRAPIGQFASTNGEFRFDVTALTRPLRPWINVIANADFGAQLSEAGGGYTWATNSRLNMLTGWSNDPVSDPASEWFLLQDLKTMQVWSVSPSAFGDVGAEYRVAHGQGYTSIGHQHGALEVRATWCVDPETAVKQVRLRLVNRGHKTLQMRAIGIAEWVMGANRADRGTTHTSALLDALAPITPGFNTPRDGAAEAMGERRLTALFCRQRDRSAGFGDGTAFLALIGEAEDQHDWTTDRRECFDARGRLVIPDNFGQAVGTGFDPCAALSTRFTLRAGDTVERVFLLGFGNNPELARQLAQGAPLVPALQRLQSSRDLWDGILDAATVETPDPLFDAMVNRWLMYQTVVCRLWAKAGFYQAGGAYGFRDQLQDSMALAWAAPHLFRQQIVLSASRQFAAGDVQHWWHAPTGAGVRTHFSDDLLWLPHACTHYLQATGDRSLLDEKVPFLDGAEIPAGAEDAYYVPSITTETVTVFEHAARAIDRSLRHGVHGLPLMGTGDWNDGMNRVGHEGRGESVWLAWFLLELIAGYAPIARARGENERADRWEAAARDWQMATSDAAWDGAWYRRAFFDDGAALGSSANDECRIDLIAQAWSVISRAAPADKAALAMVSVDSHLVDHDAGLVRLLMPPLQEAEPSAGYIQAYPKGVRENGGQYSHAGVWALIAQAQLGNGDKAYQYFTYLSPAHRSRNADHGAVYAIEPYVMAGDVYSAAPYVGRGGWSWYTGSAAWMHRAAIESMFGMRQHGEAVSFEPCLPSHWPRASLTLKRDGRSLRVIFARANDHEPSEQAASLSAQWLPAGTKITWSRVVDGASYFVVI